MCIYVCVSRIYLLTLVHLHVRDSLPLVHGHEPPGLDVALALLAAAAKVYDEPLLVAAEGAENGVEAGLAELAVREEEGRDDDLLSSSPRVISLSVQLGRRCKIKNQKKKRFKKNRIPCRRRRRSTRRRWHR